MTGPVGNSEFCTPRGTLRVAGKQNSLFPLEPVIKCLKELRHGLRILKNSAFSFQIRRLQSVLKVLSHGILSYFEHRQNY